MIEEKGVFDVDFYTVLIVLIVASVVILLGGMFFLYTGCFASELLAGTFLFVLGTSVLIFAVVLICSAANLSVIPLF